jgi:sugar phosphate isomerase/epimerase
VADELLPEDRGAELREIVGRCLREDPNERFSDARSLGEALAEVDGGEGAAVVRRIKSQAGTKQLPAGATASWPNPADAARRRHSLRVRVVAIVAALALVAAALTVALGSDGGSDSPTKAVGAKQPPRRTEVPRSDDPAQQARELADFLRAQSR